MKLFSKVVVVVVVVFSSFMKLLTNFSLIVCLVLTKQLMDYFYGISVTLQTKSFDISQQVDEIQNLTKELKKI